ncbi:MAG: small multi-drug export protein [Clostridia bacterium]
MLWPILKTVLIAMVPILELRGAIPVGVAGGLSLPVAFIAAFIGNLLPIPFAILFIRTIFEWIKRKMPKFKSLVERYENSTRIKAEKAKKYKIFGLMLFVAIPLPGTGAWTGALIAAILEMRLRDAMPPIALGVLIAGIIVSAITYGASALIGLTMPTPTPTVFFNILPNILCAF